MASKIASSLESVNSVISETIANFIPFSKDIFSMFGVKINVNFEIDAYFGSGYYLFLVVLAVMTLTCIL